MQHTLQLPVGLETEVFLGKIRGNASLQNLGLAGARQVGTAR